MSDLHLCPEMPNTAAAFLSYLEDTPADALFILGDLFESWVGDDSLSLPFERTITAALSKYGQRRTLAIMHGNRDFLLGPAFFSVTSSQALYDPCLLVCPSGKYLLSHGDTLCTSDFAYQRARLILRSQAWQENFLSRSLEERLILAKGMRQQSKSYQQQASVGYVDVDSSAALELMLGMGVLTMIHGHTHQPGEVNLNSNARRIVLSDWDLDDPIKRGGFLSMIDGCLTSVSFAI